MGIDPIPALGATISAFQTVVSRRVNPFEGAVVSITRVEAGNTWNIIPEEAELEGTARTLNPAVRDAVQARLEAIAVITARAHGCEAEFEYERGSSAVINDAAACERAAALAREAGARLHIAHITTAEELALAAPEAGITLEACVPHLLYTSDDYTGKGSLIKCNPAVKGARHREALRQALTAGLITTVGTDHAPHLLSEKAGGALKAMSGMPMVQFSLCSMLTLADEGVLTKERLVSLMCHNPARLFGIREQDNLYYYTIESYTASEKLP